MFLAVVDDDLDVRTALGRLLRSFGHTVRLFSSAEEFEREAPRDVDCIVLDVRLPGLNGFEFHDRLRSKGSALPVVFITGDDDPVRSGDARCTGAPTLPKPFDGEALMAAIGDAVTGARTR